MIDKLICLLKAQEMVYQEYKQPMDKLEDLLPGIEQFLSNVLANETLSPFAEEQRQYFLERLDIIKLPPSIPPRPHSLGQPLCPSSPHSNRDSHRTSSDQDDFAAYQRELSRALLESETSPNVTETKVYDDIDLSTIDFSSPEVKVSHCTEDEESVYEIPKLRKTTSDFGYEKAKEISPLMTKSTSSDEQPVILSAGTPKPPPLPPRKERQRSDFRIRSSSASLLDDTPGDLGNPCDLPKVMSADLSDMSFDRNSNVSKDGLDDYDGVSVNSQDDSSSSSAPQKPPDLLIKLPRSTRTRVRAQRKLGKSMSSLIEVTQPFRTLEDVVISGELHYRSKLTWTKKMVAVMNGRLVGYKVDRLESRPSIMMLLTGYKASFHKREGRRSYEIHLDHVNFEQHVFLVDFKEWAEIWCQHLNAAAEGRKAPGPVLHLTRDSLIDKNDPSTYSLSKIPAGIAGSNLSLASVGSDMSKERRRDHLANRSNRKKTISQFFDSLSKKSSVKKSVSSSLDSTHNHDTSPVGSTPTDLQSGSLPRPGSQGSQSSLEVTSPMTPESGFLDMSVEIPLREKHIKHQGYLGIFSSFNKRKWGKRWCMVHENNFECYRSPKSTICELEFLLRNCVLRRAIEETKSELGLMLLENNKEKITIEPLSWSELGSWLRILMKETSTPSTPDGLLGYMDDSHPYHEAVEITWTRVYNTSNMTNCHETFKAANRDSRIVSSESSDGKFGSLEHAPRSSIVHRDFSDASLPRLSVSDTGAIYTQVRKLSVTGSIVEPVGSFKSVGNQIENKAILKGDDSDSHNSSLQNSIGDFEASDFDFESALPGKLKHLEREESLVDEIMFHINSQIHSSPFSKEMASHSALDDSSETINDKEKRNINRESETLNEDRPVVNGTVRDTDETVRANKREVHTLDVDSEETLSEMRTRLVQLKQDRISIRDRRDKVASEVDRQFLSAEFERLDRECKKLDEEIKLFEQEHCQFRRQESHKKLAGMASVQEEDEVEDVVQLVEVNIGATPESVKPVIELAKNSNVGSMENIKSKTNIDIMASVTLEKRSRAESIDNMDSELNNEIGASDEIGSGLHDFLSVASVDCNTESTAKQDKSKESVNTTDCGVDTTDKCVCSDELATNRDGMSEQSIVNGENSDFKQAPDSDKDTT